MYMTRIDSDSILSVAFEEQAKVFLPLSSLNTPERVTALMNELGWELPGSQLFPVTLTDFTDGITSVIDALARKKDTTKEEEFISYLLELGTSLASLSNMIYGSITNIESILIDYQDFLTNSTIKDEFTTRLIDYLMVTYLQTSWPEIYSILVFLGIIENKEETARPEIFQPKFVLRRIHWDRPFKLVTEPQSVAEDVYSWLSSFSSDRFLAHLDLVMRTFSLPGGLYDQDSRVSGALTGTAESLKELRIPFFLGGSWPTEYIEGGVHIGPVTDSSSQVDGLALIPYLLGDATLEYNVSPMWKIKFSGSADLNSGFGVTLRPPMRINLLTNLLSAPSMPTIIRFQIKLVRESSEKNRKGTYLFGTANTSHFSVEGCDVTLWGEISEDSKELGTQLNVNNAELVVKSDESDGFLETILPKDGIRATFDLGVGWSSLTGVYFRGSAALDVTIPLHISLGPIKIESTYLALAFLAEKISITIAATLNAKIGPISASVNQIGLEIPIIFPDDGGNLGPANIDLGFKWPNGVGLAINAAGLTGGGFLRFDHDNERYEGVLQLAFSEIGLVAITLITTRMPDGSKGFSMLSLINVTFDPAISLPYNFYLHGVGGLLGIQRTMKTDVIRDGLKEGTLDSVMFPEGDIIIRAPQIISDLRSIFPPTEDRYTIGLMAKLSWSELVYADIGLFIEVPMPIKMAVLGQVYTYLPSEDAAIIELHLDVLGVLDLEQKKLYFMASIYNSRILVIDLYGDAYIGLSWGNRPYFVLSLGGFHPRDKTIPADVPSLRRLTLSIGSGNNPRITLKTYLALTSTSLGFGAKLDLLAKAGPFRVEGYMGFDALIIFTPFSFEVEIGAGVAIKVDGATLLSISLDLLLSGPTPWHVSGKAKFTILFFTIKVKVSATWGSRQKATLPTVNPWPPLKEALEHKKNWGGALPSGEPIGVQIRQIESTGSDILIFATGYLEIRQNVLPLGIKITRFRNNVPMGDINQFDISQVYIKPSDQEAAPILLDTDPTLDYFAMPMFKMMSDDEIWCSAAYVLIQSGVRGKSTEINVSTQVDYELKYETEIIDENKMARKLPESTKCNWRMSKFLLRGGAASKAPILNSGDAKYRIPRVKPAADLIEERYSIVYNADMTELDSTEIPNNGTLNSVLALQAMEEYLADNPQEVGKIQIVPQCEVNAIV